MKYFVLTKKNILAGLFCVFIGAIACMIAINSTVSAITVSGAAKINPIYCVNKEEKVLSLSFNAAWDDAQTLALLDILDTYNIKTTFFLVGEWVMKYPESVKEIYKRGHDIGSHGDEHLHMSKLTAEEMDAEILNCNSKITKLTGQPVTLFRPPYGDYNNAVVEAVRKNNMYCLQWSIDSLDWQSPSAETITQRITKNLSPGAVILLHNGAENTPEALPMIIEGILEQEYTIVPISQMLLQGEYITDHEGRMFSIES